MFGRNSVLLFLVVTSCHLGWGSLAQRKRGAEPDAVVGDAPRNETSPCSCALLNFWDTAVRQDSTKCCKALQFLCLKDNSLACGHVHRFCTKQKAGYSAWVLDVFVREQLKELGTCVEFNPNATHDERCGDGWCRIGYTCTTVKAQRCRKKQGVRCGDGYCKYGSFCAEMSSENCDQMTEDELKKLQKIKDSKDIDSSCNDGRCSVCTRDTQYQCVYKQQTLLPCQGRECADSVQCGVEEESVCTVRPEVLVHVDDLPEEHDPEKVDESKLRRRLTAFILPTVAVVISVIFSIALLSWVVVRVKRARKEAAQQAEEDCLEHTRSTQLSIKTDASANDEKDLLSPHGAGNRTTPRIRLPLPLARLGLGGGDLEGSARSSGRRSHYRSVSDTDTDGPIGHGGYSHGGGEKAGYQARGALKRTRSRSVDGDKDVSGDEMGSSPGPHHYRHGSKGNAKFV